MPRPVSLLAMAAILLVGGVTGKTATSPASAAEYRIAVGDVLELSAASLPEFRHRAAVGVDGEVSLPLVGDVPAARRTLPELRKAVKELIPRKTFRRRALDGSEHEVVIDADEITLAIAEYGPVYVNGDVSRPGAYPYRPGLTVRQALSLAGGYDMVRSRNENPYLLAPDVRSDIESLTAGLAREQARIARIQIELGQSSGELGAPSSSPIAAQINGVETDQLSTRLADLQKERGHLSEVIRSLRSRLDLLQGQIRTERDRARIDQEELDRIQGLFDKGMVPITRLTDVKRLILLSASRASDIESRSEQTKTELEVVERRLQRLDDERRMELLKELQEAQLQLTSTRSKIDASHEKLFYLGALRSKIGRTATGASDLTIVRRSGSGAEHIVATEEMELFPSDVVEVALRLDAQPAPAPASAPVSQAPRPVAPVSSAQVGSLARPAPAPASQEPVSTAATAPQELRPGEREAQPAPQPAPRARQVMTPEPRRATQGDRPPSVAR